MDSAIIDATSPVNESRIDYANAQAAVAINKKMEDITKNSSVTGVAKVEIIRHPRN